MNTLTIPTFLFGMLSLASAQQVDLAPGTRATAEHAPLFDQISYDEPRDGQLWVRGKTYKASFGFDGATYIPFLGSDAPRNMPVRMSLQAASLGGQALSLNNGASWSRDGDAVTLERGEVDVRYHIGINSIEQTFLVDELPFDGDLVVRVAVETELSQRSTENGFLFDGERGGVHYGEVTVFDFDGRSQAVESRLEEGEITIRVPEGFLREASLPLVIDPVISTHGASTGHLDSWAGDMAFDATHGRFMQTFTHNFSADDSDVYSTTVDEQGTIHFADAAWIDVTSADWTDPSIANNNAANSFLIASRVNVNNVAQVWSRTRTLPGTGMGIQRKLNLTSDYCAVPKVGGDGNVDGTTYFCVAWGEYQGSDIYDIRYRLINSDGTAASSVVTLDSSMNEIDPMICISKGVGIGEASQRSWNLTWAHHPDEDSSDIRGAQLRPNGWLKTPAFNMVSTPTRSFHANVSAPLITGVGGTPDYLVAYVVTNEPFGSNLNARIFKGDSLQGSYDLTQLEADVLGQQHTDHDQNNPHVATDGVQFVVAYTERASENTQENVFVSSFGHHASNLFLTETKEQISTGEGRHRYPNIASAADAGLAGSRSVGFSWLRMIYDGNDADYDTLGGVYRTPAGYADIGNSTCDGSVNTTGQAATFRAFGVDHPAFNQVFLDVDNLPAFQWGQFLMSQSQANLPIGSGFLCLGGPQIRLPSTVGNSWFYGAVGTQLDLTALPPAANVMIGQSWFFQYWYRDTGTSNLSNALRIDF